MKQFSDFHIDVGDRQGIEVKTTCPQCSATRKKSRFPCLNVNTEKGVWNCWHCAWSGTLRDGETTRPTVQKAYRRPDYVATSGGLPAKIVAWFENRGITPVVLKRNQIGYGAIYMPQLEEEATAVQFPYFRGTEVVNIKYRDGRKNFRMAAGAERVLYGLNDIASTTVWVEGEIDKLSLEVAGFANCVSVPDGAPAPESKSYASKFDFLDAPELDEVERHIIAVDSDAPGKRLQEELVRRLHPEKCLIVTWPEDCKDANEVLTLHGPGEIVACIREARPVPIAGTYEAIEFEAKLNDYYANGLPLGMCTGWANVDRHYTVRPGEWTLVTGIPSHGKSEWLDALAVNLAQAHGWSFGVFSPENQPLEFHIAKLEEKYAGKPFNVGYLGRMTLSEHDVALTWVHQHFIFILPESYDIETILSRAKALVRQKGIRGLIIDPWNELDHSRPMGLTETEYISRCLSKVRAFARDHGVHVWVVAHPAKMLKGPDRKYPVPTPYDVSGSAHWRNKADCCVTVYRDMEDEAKAVEIHIQKIRHKVVGSVGMSMLFYDKGNGRYSAEPL